MLKKLKSKLVKRLGSETRSEQQAEDSLAYPRSERYGLILVASSPANPTASRSYPVDIVAIHGLNGDAFTTWTHTNGTLWIKDLLPQFLPGCRVFTYGYPSQLVFNSSFARVQEYARVLLSSLRDVQEDMTQNARPVIFLCHSLGGIVCKQALVFAHEDGHLFAKLLQSIGGIVFLGTPHRGSAIATFASVVGRIINTSMATASVGMRPGPIRTDLLEQLHHDSEALQEVSLAVRNRLRDMRVVSFYETEPTPPLSSLIVDRTSSLLEIPDEEIIPLYVNHRDLCRFPGETPSYEAVSHALRRTAIHLLERVASPQRQSLRSQSSLNDTEKTCMVLLSAFDITDYVRLLPRPMQGTCQWILGHPMFASWCKDVESSLLWLTGHPGCGKTILASFLAQHLKDSNPHDKTSDVWVYYCDDKIEKQKDAKNILLGLIHQIVHRHHNLVRHVRKVFERQGPTLIQSFAALWETFLQTVEHSKSNLTYIIIDALDECDRETCQLLLQSISELAQHSLNSKDGGKRIKFLLTSRPTLSEPYTILRRVQKQQICIDENQEGYCKDLQIFVANRVEEISRRRRCSTEMEEYLLQTLLSKADQTFLWIHVVLASLENSPLASMKDFQNILSKIPPDLQTTYLSFANSIHLDHRSTALRLLKLLVACSRPLKLDELNTAFTINATHRNVKSIDRDRQTAMSHTTQSILGPLVRVSLSEVSLLHQSVKDFLLGFKDDLYAFPEMRDISIESSALQMSVACISYLLLEDFSGDMPATESPTSESSSEPSGTTDHSPIPGLSGLFWDQDVQTLDLFKESNRTESGSFVVSRYDFYHYAALHWTEHLALCESSAPVELKSAAKKLLRISHGNCTAWLEYYREATTANVFDIPDEPDALVLAARFNLHRILLDLLSECAPYPSLVRSQALFWASYAGNSRSVKALLDYDADPNAQIFNRQTALIAAAEHGHLDCVVALLATTQTNVNAQGRHGRTALSYACGNGHFKIAMEILRKPGCKADEVDHDGCTPLFWAVGGDHIPIMQMLIRRSDININHQDKSGRTVVSWAAGDGMKKALRHLLKTQGVDANIKDVKGRSPLSWAAGNGCSETVRVLVQDPRVNKSSVDNDKRNAVSWATAGAHFDTLQMLLRYGCGGVDAKDIDGWTPLAWAIQNDAANVVEALLSTGLVDLASRDHSGRAILSWAVNYGHVGVVRALLQKGADPEAVDSAGETPLSIAERLERQDLIDELSYWQRKSKERQ
ncbi:ankyrin repeat protein [Colletotrichum tofieldiae]|uniref:Ankyrin repeat protein n=1 Tax=Colletotrichum tofieldiae TaxID=708197 RepID=A0A166SNR9_9PEZI|nr:ankyrin repeat protein [Colletotrichum tofieldiae]